MKYFGKRYLSCTFIGILNAFDLILFLILMIGKKDLDKMIWTINNGEKWLEKMKSNR